MSRTKRKIYKASVKKGLKRDNPRITEGGDAHVKGSMWIGKKKMKPYSKNPGKGKYKVEKSEFTYSISTHDKLITKNANRSLKKGVRQQIKKEIKDELRQYTGHS